MDHELFENFKNIVFGLIRDHLYSIPEDTSISYPDIFRAQEETLEDVEEVLDGTNEADDTSHRKLGSIKSTWLHRRLTTLL